MKTSKTGYKDTSPDRGEKALMIPSNIITMKGVSHPITAIPIYNGKPDFSKKRILQPEQEDVTFDGAEGVMEIPMAQVGIGINGSYTNTNTYGFPNTTQPQSWQDFQNRYTPNGQGIQPNLNPNNIPQDFNFNNLSSYISQNYNIPITQPDPFSNSFYSNQINNGVISLTDEQLNTPDMYRQMPSLNAGTNLQNMRGYFSENDMVEMGDTNSNTRENPNGIQELSNLLNNFQGADLNSSLARAGFGFGFNASDYNWVNPQAQSMASTGNTIATIGAVGNSVLKGAKEFMSGMASANRQAQAYRNYNEDMDRVLRNQSTEYYKEGGKISQQKKDEMIVTGGYTTGLPENAPIVPNAEVEKSEYIQNPDGTVQEVLGEKHSNGGELMNLENGTRVISDYLKIGGKLAKELSKEYDLKLQASNSYATVIDKYKKKIGLTELLEEQTSVAGKIKDQEEVDNDNVKEINLSYLSQRFNDIEAEKQPLDKQLSLFTNEIYNKQEESKTKDKPKSKYQEGGQVESEQVLQAYSQFSGIPLEQLLEEFNTFTPEEQQQALGEMVQEMQGGQQPDPQQIISAYAQATQVDPNAIIQQLQQLSPEQQQQALVQMTQQLQGVQQQEQSFRDGGKHVPKFQMGIGDFKDYYTGYTWDPSYKYGDLPNTQKRAQYLYDINGIPYEQGYWDNQADQMTLDKIFGAMQVGMIDRYPTTTTDYMTRRSNTKQDLDKYLEEGWVTEKQLNDLGIKTANGKVIRGVREQELGKEVDDKIYELLNTADQEKLNEYRTKGFYDNKAYYRGFEVPEVQFDSQQDLDNYLKETSFTAHTEPDGTKVYKTDKEGLYFRPLIKDTPAEKPPAETPSKETTTNKDVNVEQSQRSPQFPWMNMNQRVPIPMGLDFGRMQSINPININPINISPQEQLNTINSQTQTALDAINFTPGATRAAQIANIFNLGTQASNQAYAQTQAQNAQLNRQAEIFNETNVGQADRMNTELAESYQNRYLQALAALEGQQLGWYQYNNQVDALNMRNQFNSNIASSLFPNYRVDSSGNLIYAGGQQNYAPQRQPNVTPPISKEGGEVKDFIRTMLNKKKK